MGHSIVECVLLTGTCSAEGIMASGHVNRTNRPNTWLLRPLLHTCRKLLPTRSRPHMAQPGYADRRPGYSKALDCEPLTVSGWVRAWHRYQLRQLSEVLGGCCEDELVTGAVGAS